VDTVESLLFSGCGISGHGSRVQNAQNYIADNRQVLARFKGVLPGGSSGVFTIGFVCFGPFDVVRDTRKFDDLLQSGAINKEQFVALQFFQVDTERVNRIEDARPFVRLLVVVLIFVGVLDEFFQVFLEPLLCTQNKSSCGTSCITIVSRAGAGDGYAPDQIPIASNFLAARSEAR
jgi:hypothetical protein